MACENNFWFWFVEVLVNVGLWAFTAFAVIGLFAVLDFIGDKLK